MTALLNEKNANDWESMAHALRGGLRMLRAFMDLRMQVIDGVSNKSLVDWETEYLEVRDSINDLLREVVGEK